MTGHPLIDQELVVHLFAPCNGPRAARAQQQLSTIWSRCRALLGTTRPIPSTLLPTDLPLVSSTDDAVERALAAMEDDTGDCQVIARQIHDLLNVSVVFAAPTDSSERRRRIGSAAPPTWVEFGRWWDELSAGATDALLGEARLYLAKRAADVTPDLLTQALRVALPHVDDRLWAQPEHCPPEFLVWETTTPLAIGMRRDVVVIAPVSQDPELSAWTWSQGGVDIPPLARYLMHAAKVRYQLRVWEGEQASVTTLRRRIDDQVHTLPNQLDEPALFDPLAVDEAHGVIAATMMREMQHTVAVGASNMATALPTSLPRDRGLADSLCQQLDDAITYLDLAVQRARQIREIAGRPEPQPMNRRAPITRPERRPASTTPAAMAIRMGFSLDIVGYSRRSAPAKENLQQRLAALLDAVLDDIGTDITDTDRQGTGDGMHVFLPQTIQLHEALPTLLRSWRDRLGRDNQRFTDRMRLRLAAAIGPVGLAALGFGGSTVIEVSRLLDSPPVRQLVIDEPQRDLAAIVSDQLYSYVIGEGYPGLAADEFRPTEARVKTFSAKAWLWRP